MERLKKLRKQHRLNQTGLALKLNVSQSTISEYECDKRMPDLGILIRMADFFNVSIDYLADLTDVRQQIRQNDFSSNELEHLYIYRQLSDKEKEKVNAFIQGLQSQE